MLEFIIILIVAILVIPLTFLLISKKKIQRDFLLFVVSGIIIALFALFVGNNFPFYYTVLAIFGLAFAFSVLLDKPLNAKQKVTESIIMKESAQMPEAIEESELQRFLKVENETAATVEEEDLIVEETNDEDLEMFMSDIPMDPIDEKKERKRDEK